MNEMFFSGGVMVAGVLGRLAGLTLVGCGQVSLPPIFFFLFPFWDFYFCALGSLVVLSFPQPLSFSSVLPKPLSETLTRSSDGRISV
jgi:hypothetical protein